MFLVFPLFRSPTPAHALIASSLFFCAFHRLHFLPRFWLVTRCLPLFTTYHIRISRIRHKRLLFVYNCPRKRIFIILFICGMAKRRWKLGQSTSVLQSAIGIVGVEGGGVRALHIIVTETFSCSRTQHSDPGQRLNLHLSIRSSTP